MKSKFWSIIPCAVVALTACDVAQSEFEAQSAEVDAAGQPLAGLTADHEGLVSQNYCDHADRVMRAEVLRTQREADGELAKDRERALLDDLRAGEAVFAGVQRLDLRSADEVHVGFKDGFLVATAPRVDAPLAKLRLANGIKVHVFAKDVRKIVLTESVARADIAHLILMTDLDGPVTVDVEAPPACLVIDGGGDAAVGPLEVNGSALGLTAAPTPTNATITGTSGNDTLNGTSGSDQIYAFAGVDGINGGGSVDYLYGNEDKDLIIGGGGVADQIYGGKGDDLLYGSGNGEWCYGDEGYDKCAGCYAYCEAYAPPLPY